MIRIAVVEDDDAYAQTLTGYIRRYVAESKEALACERFADGMTFLEEQRGGRFLGRGGGRFLGAAGHERGAHPLFQSQQNKPET